MGAPTSQYNTTEGTKDAFLGVLYHSLVPKIAMKFPTDDVETLVFIRTINSSETYKVSKTTPYTVNNSIEVALETLNIREFSVSVSNKLPTDMETIIISKYPISYYSRGMIAQAGFWRWAFQSIFGGVGDWPIQFTERSEATTFHQSILKEVFNGGHGVNNFYI